MADLALIVPIDVQALSVPAELAGSNSWLAAIAADFGKLPTDAQDGAYLANTIFAAPFQLADPAEAGVHLHWALPDALARGQGGRDGAGGGERTSFPPLPNRWLVARIAVPRQGPPSLAGWLIESDTLWPPSDEEMAKDDPNRMARLVPVDPRQGNATARKMGRAVPLAQWNAGSAGGEGAKLTALGYGMLEYAAAYPHCANVLGFWDAAPSLDCALTYQVIGWYADTADDPLHPKPSGGADQAKAALAALGWRVAGTDAVPADLGRTVCAGCLAGVQWPPSQDQAKALAPTTVKADLAVGQSIPEAVAALLVQTAAQPGTADDERAMLALQLGLLQGAPTPDSAAELDEACHLSTFAARASGTVWVPKPGPGTKEALPPEALARRICTLNEAQAAFDLLRARFVDCRRQIFADWHQVTTEIKVNNGAGGWDEAANLIYAEACQLLLGTVPLPTQIAPIAAEDEAWIAYALNQDVLAPPPVTSRPKWVGGALGDLLSRRADLMTMQQAIARDAGAGGWTLAPAPAPVFREPMDPVILLRCEDVDLHPRHGGDGAGTPDGLLVCRLATGVLVPSDLAGAGALPALDAPADLPGEAASLVREAMLLDAKVRDSAGLGPVPAEPAGIGRAEWAGQPWLPLLVQWEVSAELNPASADLFKTFSLDSESVDLVRPQAGSAPRTVRITGQTTLTARTSVNLQSALKTFQSLFPGDTDDHGEHDYSRADCAALTLSGFHAALLMRHQALQLPPLDPFADQSDPLATALSLLVPVAVGPESSFAPASETTAALSPVRAGALQVTRLRVVDAFGRYRDIEPEGGTLRPIVPGHLGGAQAQGVAELPARLAQPSRLRLQWLSAGGGAAAQPEGAVCLSPVCGWVIVNRLEQALAVYDAAGEALGSLVPDMVQVQPPPGAGLPASQAKLAAADPELRQFMAAALARKGWVAALLAAIDAQMKGVNPLGIRQDQGLALLAGAPLALVRASVRLELCGLPALVQGANGVPKAGADLPGLRDFSQRDRGGFEALAVPLRLGDLGVLEDGLIGYFLPQAPGSSEIAYGTFYAEALAPPHNGLLDAPIPRDAGMEQPDLLTLAPCWIKPDGTWSGPDLTLAMLIDPRGAVHGTTGVLPVIEARLPPALVADALRRIALSFQVAPALAVLGSEPTIPELPLPAEPGYAWAWVLQDLEPADLRQGRALLTEPAPLQLLDGWLALNRT